MSSNGKRHELPDERKRLRSAYADRHPGRTEIAYRNHRIVKEPQESVFGGTWRIVSPSGEYLATVDLDDFDSCDRWLRFVDTAIQSGVDRATELFDVTHA